MSSSAVQQVLNSYIEALPGLLASRYVAAAALVVVMYDWLLTLGDEVRLIYPGPASLIKVLYITIRVSTVAGLLSVNYRLSGLRPAISDLFCQLSFALGSVLQILVIATSNFLLMRRVGPLYENRARVVYGLHFLFLASYVTTIALSMKAVFAILPGMQYERVSNSCFTTLEVRPSAAIFLGPLVLETVVVLMTACKAYGLTRKTPTMPRILQVFFRDGLVHYTVMLAVRIFCIIIYFTLPFSYVSLGIYLLWAIVTTMTTRLFINLRSLNQEEAEETPCDTLLERHQMPQSRESGNE